MRFFRKSLLELRQPRRMRLQTYAALTILVAGASLSLSAQQTLSVRSFAGQPLAGQPLLSQTFVSQTSADSAREFFRPSTPEAPALASVSLPDAPDAPFDDQTGQSSSSQTPQSTDRKTINTDNPDAVSTNGTQQTKRILGIMPNFRSVSADVKLPPMTPKQKFIIAGKDTFDYSSFFIAGIQAGFSMSGASYPEFHQGVVGYGRYYWHTLADTIDENFMVGGLGPVVFHQDNRFYTLGHGGFTKRTWYAWTRVLVSRKDDGSPTPNFAEVIGSGAASGLSTLYYPTRYRTWTKVGQKWLTSDLIDGANFMLKEFWPDINKFLSRRF